MYIARVAHDRLEKWQKSNKILILLGGRQVGKTTLLKHVFQGSGTRYLNLDIDTDLQKMDATTAMEPKQALRSLQSPRTLIIDEAQRMPEISRIVKGWYDSALPVKIILSGSSSLNLLDSSAESLTGRNIKILLPPLIFQEILATLPWYSSEYDTRILAKTFNAQVQVQLISSLTYGCYPEVQVTSTRDEYLINLVSDFLLKDIFQFGLVKDPQVVKKLLLLLAYQIGSIVSINELSRSLQISRATVERYLDLLEATYVIFRLEAYSTNPRKELAKSKKIYFWDTGIRNALIGELKPSSMRSDIGQVWENWVVAEFAKQNLLGGGLHRLFFWRSRTGSEVDLVVKAVDGSLRANEIKWAPKRSISKAFSTRYGIPVAAVNHTNFVTYINALLPRPGDQRLAS